MVQVETEDMCRITYTSNRSAACIRWQGLKGTYDLQELDWPWLPLQMLQHREMCKKGFA